MDNFTISLIVSLVILSLSTFFFGLGEFSNSLMKNGNTHIGYFESCLNSKCYKNSFNNSLAITLIGFLFSLHSALFSLLTIIFQNRLQRNDHFKLLIGVLIYNVISVIFMIIGWNELRLYINSVINKESWSYNMLIIGFSLNFLAFGPIIYSIVKSNRFVK
jgi:hypothetical protein